MPFQASRYPTYGQAIPTNSCLSVKVFERGRRNKRQCTWSIARFRSGYHRSAWRRVCARTTLRPRSLTTRERMTTRGIRNPPARLRDLHSMRCPGPWNMTSFLEPWH
ncbi:hypothetical protein I7I50_09523 [Histoplasma capsulatum G186AR]|uniref:Uncharacterized protein n=1 Tax=Ajellomyces capsulatus TaxID=5037 RepID=A0A8H8D0G4_AJECA|nr:hypothetical protein I7I52_07044 [Histoplasma capsulatum]QSS74385.1 hypothetical protein I7I50_09523 [Histoplasma capsulatum G186AR]